MMDRFDPLEKFVIIATISLLSAAIVLSAWLIANRYWPSLASLWAGIVVGAIMPSGRKY